MTSQDYTPRERSKSPQLVFVSRIWCKWEIVRISPQNRSMQEINSSAVETSKWNDTWWMIMYNAVFEQNICLHEFHFSTLFAKQSRTGDSRGTKYSRSFERTQLVVHGKNEKTNDLGSRWITNTVVQIILRLLLRNNMK